MGPDSGLTIGVDDTGAVIRRGKLLEIVVPPFEITRITSMNRIYGNSAGLSMPRRTMSMIYSIFGACRYWQGNRGLSDGENALRIGRFRPCQCTVQAYT